MTPRQAQTEGQGQEGWEMSANEARELAVDEGEDTK
jgi:hypothetical protein